MHTLLLSSSSKSNKLPLAESLRRDTEDALLVALVDAAMTRPEALPDARQEVRERMGDDALVDAAAVMGAFQAYNRIVDATGVPLDPIFSAFTKDLQQKHGYDRFSSARESDVSELVGKLQKASAPVARWLLRQGMKSAQRVL